MSKEISDKVKDSRRPSCVDEAKVVDEASFIDDLGADSLDTVELSWLLRKNLDQKFLTVKQKRYLLLEMRLNLLKVSHPNKNLSSQ